ncbi:MAG: hypothetical protein AB7E70_13170 [Hyphomicrobiaceae bacterium]
MRVPSNDNEIGIVAAPRAPRGDVASLDGTDTALQAPDASTHFDMLLIPAETWEVLIASGFLDERLATLPHDGLLGRQGLARFRSDVLDRVVEMLEQEIDFADFDCRPWLMQLEGLVERARLRGAPVLVKLY